MVIAIEGMDGVGKTTISKRLAKTLKYIYVDKPLHYLLPGDEKNNYLELNCILRKMYDLDDSVIKAWMIGLGNLYSCRQFKNKNIILDRHLVSNYFWNGTEESKEVFRSLIKIIGAPDITILLCASLQTRKNRLYQRDKNDRDIKDSEIMVEGYDKMKKFLEEFRIPYIQIDTDGKNEDEVYRIVLKNINFIIKGGINHGNIEPGWKFTTY